MDKNKLLDSGHHGLVNDTLIHICHELHTYTYMYNDIYVYVPLFDLQNAFTLSPLI